VKNCVAAESVAPAPQNLLPETFAGWQITGTPEQSTQASAADPGDAVPLQDMDSLDMSLHDIPATTAKMTVKGHGVWRRHGRFGAFTF